MEQAPFAPILRVSIYSSYAQASHCLKGKKKKKK
jgi:hypothetical protein